MLFEKPCIIALLLAAYVTCLPAFSVPKLVYSTKWLVTMETQEIRDQFSYRGSTLRDLVRVSVTYAQTNGAPNTIRYEDVWLKEGKPLGLERYEKLRIPANDDVAICLSPKSGSSTKEQEAAAQTILKMIIELYNNGNIVPGIIVPGEALEGIASAIERHHFSRTTASQESARLAVFLQTEGGASTTLYYTR